VSIVLEQHAPQAEFRLMVVAVYLGIMPMGADAAPRPTRFVALTRKL
jgi:hypothetical protein